LGIVLNDPRFYALYGLYGLYALFFVRGR